MTPDPKDVSFYISNPGGEDGWVALAFEPPAAQNGEPTYLGLDLASGKDISIEVTLRPNWPGIWHLLALTYRPI